MQLIDQLAARVGAAKPVPGKDIEEADQTQLFQHDLALLENMLPPPMADLPKTGVPIATTPPELGQIDVKFVALPNNHAGTEADSATKPAETTPQIQAQPLASPAPPLTVEKPQTTPQKFAQAPSNVVLGGDEQSTTPAQGQPVLQKPEPQAVQVDAQPKAANTPASDHTKPSPATTRSDAPRSLLSDRPAQTGPLPEQKSMPAAQPHNSSNIPASPLVKTNTPDLKPLTQQGSTVARTAETVTVEAVGKVQPPQPNLSQAAGLKITTPHQPEIEPSKDSRLAQRSTPEVASRQAIAVPQTQPLVRATADPLTLQPLSKATTAEPEPFVPPQTPTPASHITASPSNPAALTPTQTAYTVHQITTQIVAEAGAKTGRDIEVRLDPEELGRIRITVHPREAGLFIALAVERPETLDLLRKNASELMANLQDFDLSGATLEFSQDDNSPPPQTDDMGLDEDPIQLAVTPPTPDLQRTSDARLDLRL